MVVISVNNSNFFTTLDGNTINTGDTVLVTEDITLTSNINLTINGGTFDGNNYYIVIEGIDNFEGVMVSPSSTSVIKNVKVLVRNLSTLADNGGWLVKFNSSGFVENCYVRNEFGNTSTINGYRSGGVIGSNFSIGEVKKCYCSMDITGEYAGGIIGQGPGDVTILNCEFDGKIGGYASGGIIGSGPGGEIVINKCTSSGEIAGEYSGGISGGFGGGIEGDNFNIAYMVIQYCYSIGDITGYGAGGIAGGFTYSCYIADCYSTGNIMGTGPSTSIRPNEFNVYSTVPNTGAGGIVGAGYRFSDVFAYNLVPKSFILRCWSKGNINTNCGGITGSLIYSGSIDIYDCYSIGTISDYAGGIIGRYFDNPNDPFLEIENKNIIVKRCYTFGNINGINAGGIIGSDQIVETIKFVWNGMQSSIQLNECYSLGQINGQNAGGIMGANGGRTYDSSGNYIIVEIIKSYSLGTINGQSAGGICGADCFKNIDATIKDCYSYGDIIGTDSGGILGARCCNSSTDNDKTLLIETCFSVGSIGDGINVGMGGIVGADFGVDSDITTTMIKKCFSLGNISSDESGGIVGRKTSVSNNTYTVECCYSGGSISGLNSGGILGNSQNGYALNKIKINYCYSLCTNSVNNATIASNLDNADILDTATKTITFTDRFKAAGFGVADTNPLDIDNYQVYGSALPSSWQTCYAHDGSGNSISINYPILDDFVMSTDWDSTGYTSYNGILLLLSFESATYWVGYISANSSPRLKQFNVPTYAITNPVSFGTPPSAPSPTPWDTSTYYTNTPPFPHPFLEAFKIDANDPPIWFNYDPPNNKNEATINPPPKILYVNNSDFYTKLNGKTISIEDEYQVVELTTDIFLSGTYASAVPVFNIFKDGFFEGAMFTIHIDGIANYEGLMPTDSVNATVKNLKINVINGSTLINGASWICKSGSDGNVFNCQVMGDNTVSVNGTSCGGIVGSNYKGNIYESECTLNITGDNAGGIAGEGLGESNSLSIVNNCRSTGIISGAGAGGIVGANPNLIDVRYCYSSGEIQGNGAGGIVGSSLNSDRRIIVRECFSHGDITGIGGGGIIGEDLAEGIIKNCYSLGEIMGQYSGGIIGQKAMSRRYTSVEADGLRLIVANCYSHGNIGTDCGGIIGAYCLTTDSGSSDSRDFNVYNCYSKGSIGTNAGGVIGPYHMQNVSEISRALIFYNYSIGDITGDNAGGIIGFNSFNDISGNYNYYIEGCYSKGIIQGMDAGGIIGGSFFHQTSYVASSVSNFVNIYDCYSIGGISGTGAGGIIGGNAGQNCDFIVKNCYSNGNILGQDAGGIIGRRCLVGTEGFVNIIRCYSYGQIGDGTNIGMGGICGGDFFVDQTSGAITAEHTSTIEESYTLGTIISDDTGGIIGRNSGTFSSNGNKSIINITNSYTVGNINGTNSGGFFGPNYEGAGAAVTKQLRVSDSYSLGTNINLTNACVGVNMDLITLTNVACTSTAASDRTLSSTNVTDTNALDINNFNNGTIPASWSGVYWVTSSYSPPNQYPRLNTLTGVSPIDPGIDGRYLSSSYSNYDDRARLFVFDSSYSYDDTSFANSPATYFENNNIKYSDYTNPDSAPRNNSGFISNAVIWVTTGYTNTVSLLIYTSPIFKDFKVNSTVNINIWYDYDPFDSPARHFPVLYPQNLKFFTDPNTGNDDNSGVTDTEAFVTLEKAVDSARHGTVLSVHRDFLFLDETQVPGVYLDITVVEPNVITTMALTDPGDPDSGIEYVDMAPGYRYLVAVAPNFDPIITDVDSTLATVEWKRPAIISSVFKKYNVKLKKFTGAPNVAEHNQPIKYKISKAKYTGKYIQLNRKVTKAVASTRSYKAQIVALPGSRTLTPTIPVYTSDAVSQTFAYIAKQGASYYVVAEKYNSSAHGEPHIIPFYYVRRKPAYKKRDKDKQYYDLPDIDKSCWRLIDYVSNYYNRLIINCSTKKLTLQDWDEFIYKGTKLVNKRDIPTLNNLTFFDKVYIKFLDSELEIDVDNHKYVVKDIKERFKIMQEKRPYYMPIGSVTNVPIEYPLTDTSKYTNIRITMENEYLELEIYSDIKVDDRSCILMGATNMNIGYDRKKSRLRGCLYSNRDVRQLKDLYDISDIYVNGELLKVKNIAVGK